MTYSSNTSPAPDPALHEWVTFKRLPRLSWKMVIVVGIVLAHSADGSSVKVGYFSPSDRRTPTTAWVERTQLIEVLNQAADEAFAAPST
jgi:hypothetical protein